MAASPKAGGGSSAVEAGLLEREDYTLVAWYRSPYAPRAGGAYDSHHRTAGIAGRTRRRGCVAARGPRAAVQPDAADRRADGPFRERSGGTVSHCGVPQDAARPGLDGSTQRPDGLLLGC